MPLQPAIQGAARQAEGFGRLAHIAAGTRQRFLNEDALHFFEAHALERRGAVPSPPPAASPRSRPRIWSPSARSTDRPMVGSGSRTLPGHGDTSDAPIPP